MYIFIIYIWYNVHQNQMLIILINCGNDKEMITTQKM